MLHFQLEGSNCQFGVSLLIEKKTTELKRREREKEKTKDIHVQVVPRKQVSSATLNLSSHFSLLIFNFNYISLPGGSKWKTKVIKIKSRSSNLIKLLCVSLETFHIFFKSEEKQLFFSLKCGLTILYMYHRYLSRLMYHHL